MSILIRRRVVLLKIESTYNTDPTPSASTDAMQVQNLQYGPVGQRLYSQENAGGTLASLAQIYGGSLLQVSFDVPVKGSGTAGAAPEFGPALRACGLGQTIVTDTSVTYAPVSSSLESATLYLFEDGKRYVLTGCRGNVSGNGPVGEPMLLSFTFTGHFTAPTDVTLPTPTLDSTVAPVLLAAGFSINSFAATISALAWDMGNEVPTPPDINAPDGYGEILITGRDVNGSFDPEDELVATEDFISHWQDGDDMVLTTGVIGSAGNRFQLSMPAVRYRDFGTSDRDGIRVYDMTYGAAESSGDDEISLAFT